MNIRRSALLILCSTILIAYSHVRGAGRGTLPPPRSIDGSVLASVPPVEDAIRFMEARIRNNPDDVVSHTLLGELHLRQARETGDGAAYQQAEVSLEQALALVPGYLPAASSLASVYLARHDFARGLAIAEDLYAANLSNLQVKVIMADAHLALGNYEKAAGIMAELAAQNPGPSLWARQAHLAELQGDHEGAMALMKRAAAEALYSTGTQENAAWYLLRIGDLYFNSGEPSQAGEYYQASLRVFDDYYPALAGMGKVYAAQGRFKDAIEYYERAVERAPHPEIMAALGDVLMAAGRTAEAQVLYEKVEAVGRWAPADLLPERRHIAVYYLEHDTHPEEALQLALAELQQRRDIYSYDSAAWAYYKNRRPDLARPLMDAALALGTRDARLHYHAGMIALEMGDRAAARTHLETALKINPYFSLLHSDHLRETVRMLQEIAARQP